MEIGGRELPPAAESRPQASAQRSAVTGTGGWSRNDAETSGAETARSCGRPPRRAGHAPAIVMAAARTPVSPSLPAVASVGDDHAAPPGSEWVAQALEARTSALRLLRYDYSSGLTLPHAGDLGGSERTAEGWRFLSDYLVQSEKLFALAAALGPKSEQPSSASIVDNSPPTPLITRVPSERSKE